MSEEKLPAVKQEGLLKKLRLSTSISTSNMHLFDSRGVIKKYDTPEQSTWHNIELTKSVYVKLRCEGLI